MSKKMWKWHEASIKQTDSIYLWVLIQDKLYDSCGKVESYLQRSEFVSTGTLIVLITSSMTSSVILKITRN